MADKTQVFPLDPDDSVRTRLTHSHEVANLAHSMGERLVRHEPRIFGSDVADAAAPTILAAIGLAHDLGNPPFGHKGEDAIRDWFKKHKEIFVGLPDEACEDFVNFEGNAQTLRLVSHLQVSAGGVGLDLTAATLAALMKYTVSASDVEKRKPFRTALNKKPGYFKSETEIVDWIREKTGIASGERHPLTWLMEACDDIAYSILDIEDSIKKSIISPEDVRANLGRVSPSPQLSLLMQTLNDDFDASHARGREAKMSEMQIAEIKTSYLRTRLIELLVTGAADEFLNNKKAIFARSHTGCLLESGTFASKICKALKDFALLHSYNHTSVLRVELQGAFAISRLMDWFWKAIVERQESADPASRRLGAFNVYVYDLISRNYRQEFETAVPTVKLPQRYRELQLLADMVSGMTDGYAMALFRDLERLSRA
jgi:dGTPase